MFLFADRFSREKNDDAMKYLVECYFYTLISIIWKFMKLF